MTALKPIENRLVRAVPAIRYPLNEKCSHPECSETTADPHHIFPRSLIGGHSWFVAISEHDPDPVEDVIPHVTGLCRKHHDDVEEHRAWIKLEEESGFVWYDRRWIPSGDFELWKLVGPLDPQPPNTVKRPRRKRKQGAERRSRRTWSISVPKDELEDGAGLLDDAIEALQEKRDDDRSPYYVLMDALNYTLLNDEGD